MCALVLQVSITNTNITVSASIRLCSQQCMVDTGGAATLQLATAGNLSDI